MAAPKKPSGTPPEKGKPPTPKRRPPSAGRRKVVERPPSLLYADLVENAPLGVLLLRDGKVTFANRRAVELFRGSSPGQLQDRPVVELVAAADRERIAGHVAAGTGGKSIPESRPVTGRRLDGTFFRAQVTVHAVRTAGEGQVAVFFEDLTLRARAEAELQEGRERERLHLEHGGDIILVQDLQGRYLQFLRAQAFGLDETAVLGKTPYDLNSRADADAIMANVRTVAETGQPLVAEIREVWQGRTRVFSEYIAPLLGAAGEVRAVMRICRDVTEQRRTEQALRESEERFRQLAETTSAAILIHQGDAFVYANPAAAAMGGSSPEEPEGARFWESVHRRFQQEARERGLVRLREEPGPARTELKVVSKDGRERWGDFSAAAIQYRGRSATILTGFDVTERHEALEALRQSESRLRAILERSPISMALVAMDGTIEYLNRKAVETFGYRPEDIPDMDRWWVLACPDDLYRQEVAATWSDRVRRAVAKDREIEGREYRITCKDGTLKTAYLFGVPVVGKVFIMLLDVTARHEAEEALRASELRYRTLLESANDALFLADARTGMLLDANSRAKELVGRSLDEIRRMHQLDLHPPEEQEVYARIFREHMKEGGRTTLVNVFVQHRDGRRIPVEISGCGIEVEGRPVVLGIFRDISDRVAIQARLAEREQQLSDIVEHSGDLFYRRTPDHVLTYVSPQAESFFDCSAEEALVRWTELITDHPANAQGHNATVRAIETGEAQPPYSLELRTRKGRTLWVEVHEAPVVRDGKVVAVVGALRDITERKAAEETVRRERDFSAWALDSIPGIFYLFDQAGKFLRWNRNLEKVTGYTSEEVGRMHPLDFFSEPDRTLVKERIGKVFREGSATAEASLVAKDGRWIPHFFNGLRVQVEDRACLIGAGIDLTARRAAEAALQESEARYRAIFEGVSEGIYLSTPEGQVLMANPALVGMLGYGSLAELLQRDIWKEGCPDPSERARFQEIMAREGQVRDLEGRWLRRDGQIIDVLESARAVRDEAGRVLFHEGTVRDITEKRRAEEALRRSERTYRGVFENAHDAVVVFEPDQERILDANEAACRLYGFDRDELAGMSLVTLSKNPLAGKARIRETLAVGSVSHFESIHFRKDGSEILLDINASVIDFKGVRAILSINRDITAQRSAEAEVLRSRERLQLILDRSPLACILWDTQFRVSFWNAAAEKIFGFPASFAIGRCAHEFIVTPERRAYVDGIMRRLLEGDETAHGESVNFTASGARIECDWFNTPLKEPDGRVVGVLSMVHDLTPRRRAELDALKRSRQLSALLAASQAMGGASDIETTARAICEAALDAFGARMAWVGLVVPESTEVQVLASAGHDEGYTRDLRIRWDESPRAQGPTGRCIKQRRIVVSRPEDPAFAPWRRAALERGYRVSCAVPLIHEDAVRGALSVYSGDPDAFGPDTLEVLEIFARQCTMAIVNASLYAEARRSIEDLITANEQLRAAEAVLFGEVQQLRGNFPESPGPKP